MNKNTDSLAMYVCSFAVFCAFVSFALLLFAASSSLELDYTEEQKQTADIYAGLIAFAGIIGLLFSGLVFFKGISLSKSAESKVYQKKFFK